MKALHVINSLGAGGAERSLAEALPGLRTRGVDSEVAVLRSVDEGVGDEIRDLGFGVHRLRGDRFPMQVGDLVASVRRWEPDLVHTTLFEADVAGRLAGFVTRTPVITSLVNTSYAPERAADPGVRRWALEATRQIDRWTARHLVDRFHAISGAVRDAAVRDLDIDPSLVTVVPRGRERTRLGTASVARRMACRQRLAIGSDRPVLVNVGRHEYQKGQRYLIEAMAELVRAHPDVLLLQAGRTGNSSTLLQSQVRDLGLQDHVRFYGHRSDLPDLLCTADVFVFPSLYEGLGGAILEAMALEVPVVASAVPAIEELLDGGRCGVLVPPRDASALATAIDEILTRPERGRRLVSSAAGRFRDRYDLDSVLDATVAMYEDTLALRDRARAVAA